VPKDKTVVLHNGIDIEKYDKRNYSKQDMREELGIERDKIVIGLIGRITLGKGHFEFIKAAEIVNREYFGKIFFLIAGGTARGEEYIEKELKKLAGEKKITNLIFTGYKENIPEILAGTDILAFPSHDESFGLALLEAMAMEVPIVTSSNSGIKDIIPSDEFAILVKPKDHEALAEGIIKLIIEPELRKKLVQNSRRRAEENFNLETITKELIKHYGI
jgi:glycosyltransferase involved in cell wall biosynthesis